LDRKMDGTGRGSEEKKTAFPAGN